MRGAWSQEKFRRTRHGKKGYNFVLSHKARRNLKQLAKERPATITETLEILIDDVNAQLKLHKAQNHKANERRDMGYAKLRKEGEQLRIAALEIWAQLDSCLLEISKLSSATLGSTAELAEEVSRHYIERKARVIENLTTAKLLRLIPH
jgi:mRNA-degrading endonuclease RelE of RelBE toxin-antitoxin system